MINEYYIWVEIPGRYSYRWHSCKPVTKERGEKLVAKYSKKYPMHRYWIEPVEPLPEGECAHVTPDQVCQFCQPKDDDYDFTDPTQNPYILNGEELKRTEGKSI
jgi:hypothetical protein